MARKKARARARSGRGISRRQFGLRALGWGASLTAVGPLLAACAQGGGGQTAQQAPVGLAVDPSATPVEPSYIPKPPTEIVLPITGHLTKSKVTFRVFAQGQATVQDFTTNAFTSWLEDRTNVHVEWLIGPTDTAQAMNKLNVMLSGGDYPDIIFDLTTRAQQMVYGTQGIFVELTDLIGRYGVRTRQLFHNYPDVKAVSTAPGGKIYAMPNVNDCYHCSLIHRLWIYKPWLDKLGLSIPQTTDEYEQVLLAFKTRDPNGNGQQDEIPLATAPPPNGDSLDWFFMNSFVFNPGGAVGQQAPWLALNKGKVQAVYTTPGWKQGLQYLNRLYRQGLIAPESFTQSRTQLQQLGNHAGDVILGSCPNNWWGGFTTVDEAHGGRWTDYVAVPPLKGPNGVRYASWNPYNAAVNGTVITKACKHPEIAVQWIDAMYWREATLRSVQGVRDTDWRWARPDEKGINGQEAVWFQTKTWGQPWNQSWMQRGPSYRSSFTRLSESVQPGHLSYENMLYTEARTKMWPYRQPKEMVLPPLFLTADEANAIADPEANLAAHVTEMFARFVRGDADIASGWNGYLSDLRSMGLDAYLKAYQQAYDGRH